MGIGSRRPESHMPLLGRRSELTELRAALDGARTGRGRLLLVAGEGGVGKTHLVRTFAEESQLTEVRTTWGSSLEAGGAAAFGPWVELLGALTRRAPPDVVLRDLGAGGPDLARLVPDLAEHIPITVPDRTPRSPGARLRLFESVVHVLRNVAGDGGLIVVLEDLHAADRGSLLLLRHVAQSLQTSGFVIVGTYRDAEARSSPTLHRLLADIARYGRRIVLGGLDLPDTATLLAAVAGPVDDAKVRTVYELTDGNPFFVLEAARVLDAAAGTGLPDDVSELLQRRLDGIGPKLRSVLRVAAILGMDFDLETLALVSGTPPAELGELVGQAATLGLFSAAAEGRWAYAHILVREAVHGGIRPSERIALHRMVGQALEATTAGRVDEHLPALAHHFYEAARAGDPADAVRCCSTAGAAAVATFAFEEAALQYSRALEAIELSPPVDHHQRGELLVALGDAHLRADEDGPAEDAYRRALRAARAAGSPVLLAHAALGFARVQAAGSEAVARGALEEARAVLPEDETILLARVLVALGALSHDVAGIDLSDMGLAMARRAGSATELGDLLDQWLVLNRHLDRLPLRLDAVGDLRRVAAKTHDPVRLVLAQQRHGEILMEAGDIAAAIVELSSAAAEAAALRLPTLRRGPTVLLAAVALLEGRLNDSEALVHEARLLGGGGSDDVEPTFQIQLWGLRRQQGRFDEMAEAARRLVEVVPDAGRGLALVMSALALAEAGDAETAGQQLDPLARELLTAAGHGRIVGAALVADISWLRQDPRWASAAHDALQRQPDHHLVIGASAVSLGSSARYLGQLSALAHRYDDAERHFEAAHASHRRLGAPGWLAHGQVDHARTLLGQASPAAFRRAHELLDAAQRQYQSLGMFVHEKRAAALVGGSGHRQSAASGEATFRMDGEYWVLEYGTGLVRLPDSKGLRYLARLLANPGREVHALDLVAGDGGAGRTASRAARPEGLESAGGGDAGALLDATAKNAYRRRVMELRETIEEASAHHDVGRLELAQQEMDFLLAELSAAVGLGGRDRKAASDAERARQSVTQAIKSAVNRVAKSHPSLGEHLRTTVRTGIYVSYAPDPAAPIKWKVSAQRS